MKQEDFTEEIGVKGKYSSSHAQPRESPNMGKEEVGK